MSEFEKSDKIKLRMDAYYYSFYETGERIIDEILSSVACAGKGYHHTKYWTDEREGGSYIDLIQNSANRASKYIHDLESERDMLKAEISEAYEDCIRLQQKINCLRMEPCMLPHCVEEINRLKAELEEQKLKDLVMFGESIQKDGKRIHPTDFYKSEIEIDRNRWKAKAEKLVDSIRVIKDAHTEKCLGMNDLMYDDCKCVEDICKSALEEYEK